MEKSAIYQEKSNCSTSEKNAGVLGLVLHILEIANYQNQ
jgi:hypothetical protein